MCIIKLISWIYCLFNIISVIYIYIILKFSAKVNNLLQLIIFLFCFKVSNGSAEATADAACVVELKESIEKMNAELSQSRSKISELSAKIREQEEGISAAQKEMTRLQEENARLARDLKEVLIISCHLKTFYFLLYTECLQLFVDYIL